MSQPPAIVVSGLTMALGVVRSLGAMGVRVIVLRYDRRDIAHRSKWCSEHQSIPNPETHEDEFVDALVARARSYGGGILIPAADEALVAISRNADKLRCHYLLACPPWCTVKVCIDKQYTYALAHANQVPVPGTFIPVTTEDAQALARRLTFPCLVKPCQSHLFYDRFHRKMIPVQNPAEMLSAYRQANSAGLDVMFQEIVPGDDTQVVNYNAYFHRGEALVEFTAEHIRNAPPYWGSPRIVLSKHIPEVIAPGRKLFRAMEFDGYACTEFKFDARDGTYKLMDINPRHNLSTLLAVRCGINFPWLHYKHLAFGELPSAGSYRLGLYWIDLTRDIGYSARYLMTEHYSLAEYLKPYLRPHVFAILDRNDPAPFIRRWAVLASQALRSVMMALQRWHRGPKRSHLPGWPSVRKA